MAENFPKPLGSLPKFGEEPLGPRGAPQIRAPQIRAPQIRARSPGRTRLRNRRFGALRELLRGGEYFSEEQMRLRAPGLFHHYIGRFRDPKIHLGDPKILPGDPKIHLGDPKILPGDPKIHLGDPKICSRDPKIHLGDPKIHLGDPKITSRDPKIHPEDPKITSRDPKILPGDPKIHLGDPKIHLGDPKIHPGDPKICSRDPKIASGNPKMPPGAPQNLQELLLSSLEEAALRDCTEEEEEEEDEDDEDEERIPDEAERELLRLEFTSRMIQNFLEGNDGDFDYSQVDENPELDNLDILSRDLEDQYFDEEEPSEAPELE